MRIVLLTGAPGAGKTTVAAEICANVDRGVHVQVDMFRKMVRAGYASPHSWNDEVARQYSLARQAAAASVQVYAQAGFTVVVDDIVGGEGLREWQGLLADHEVLPVLLRPPLHVAMWRNVARSVWTVDPQLLTDVHTMLAGNVQDVRWKTLDNAMLTVRESARLIVELLRQPRLTTAVG